MRSSAGRGRRKLALSDTGAPFLQWGRGGMQCVSGCRIKQHCPQRFCIVLPSVERSFTVRGVKDPCPSMVGCRCGGKMACISLPRERCLCIRPLFKGERQATVFAYAGRGGFPDIKKAIVRDRDFLLPFKQKKLHCRGGKRRSASAIGRRCGGGGEPVFTPKREEPFTASCSLEEERVYCAPSF